MTPEQRRLEPNAAVRAIVTTLRLVGWLLLLTVVLGLYRWLPSPSPAMVVVPTVEVILMAAITAALAHADRTARFLLIPVALMASVLALFGFGEGFYQTIFRKGFVPWTDLEFLQPLFGMVFRTEVFSRPWLVALPVVLVALLVTLLIYVALRRVAVLVRRANWQLLAAIAIALVVPAVVVGTIDRSPTLIQIAARQVRRPSLEETGPALADPALAGKAPASNPEGNLADDSREYYFSLLRDRDIHLFVVESYGHTLSTNPEHRALVEPVYERLQAQLVSSGFTVRSHFLSSPAFGGRSWLADSTLLTGQFIDSQFKYEALLDTETRNLTHILEEAGYHRVLAAPGTYEADERWRAFYSFDSYLLRYDFDYAGPFISFGAMPDQYLIYRTWQNISNQDGATFVNYVLVSSHVPFDRLPPYVEDWSKLGDGSIFASQPLRTFDNNWLTGDEYPRGYVTSIEYALTSIVDFLTTLLDREALVVIVGDHQPRIPISEYEATFSVPIHVISQDPELVDGFADFGFVEGIQPNQSLPHPGMDEFLGMLLDVIHGRTKTGEDTQDS